MALLLFAPNRVMIPCCQVLDIRTCCGVVVTIEAFDKTCETQIPWDVQKPSKYRCKWKSCMSQRQLENENDIACQWGAGAKTNEFKFWIKVLRMELMLSYTNWKVMQSGVARLLKRIMWDKTNTKVEHSRVCMKGEAQCGTRCGK